MHISTKSHLNLTFNLLQCGNFQLESEESMQIPACDIFTFFYLNNGCALLESESITYQIDSPSGIFTFPDCHYSLGNNGKSPLNITWLEFSGYMIEHYLNRANIYRSKPVFSDAAGSIGHKLNNLYTAAQTFPNRYCKMMAILYDIFANLLDAHPALQPNQYVDNANFYIAYALNYIEQNYSKNISVNDIAMASGISRKQLYNYFRELFGIPPKKYLIYYRIEKACRRLKQSGQPISDIAESVGYANQFYFARQFKRLTRMTPSDYRMNPERSEILSYHTFVRPFSQQEWESHSI